MAENVTSAKATAKMVRVSSRKVRLVLDTIRNKSVAEAFANEGPTLKRFRPRAKGSASPINKRTSHITVVVAEK